MQHFPKRILEYLWNHNDADPEPKPRKRDDDLLDADRYMHELIQQQTQTPKNNLPNHHPQPRPRRPLETLTPLSSTLL